MPRMTQPMLDDGGRLSYGDRGRVPWSTVIASEREGSYGPDDWKFAAEPAQGWAPYSWLVTINGHPYLVDGGTEPKDPGL